jgi:predicted RNA-binding protein YlxR (DUF448 family)
VAALAGPDRAEAPAPEDAAAAAAASSVDMPPPADGDGDDAPEKGPLRRCIVTRESAPKEGMLRFVLDPEARVVPDLEGRLPGRGMWLSASADVLERALKRGAFARAARRTVHVPPDLRARIEDGLRRRVRDLVGFARRGGQAVCGREAALDWLRTGKAGLLVEAADGSPAERARLIGGRGVPVVSPLPAAALGAVFGRDHAVHVAVAPGRLADAIAAEAGRLAGFAGEPAAMRS